MHAATLQELIAAFSANRMGTAKALRALQEANPVCFLCATLQVLRESAMTDPKENPGGMYLLALLLALPDALTHICDAEWFTPVESLALVHQIKTLDSQVETKLARLAVQLLPYDTDRQAALGTRILQVLGAASDPFTAMPALRQLLECHHPRIRSQAALLIGRISRNPLWAKRFDRNEDPRVVANAIESLWGLTSQAAQDAFQEACGDPRHRVAGNGAMGLYLLGAPEGAATILQLSRREDPKFRATAAWCMGRSGDPRFLPRLRKLAQDPAPEVRAPALRGLTAVSQRLRNLKAAPQLSLHVRDIHVQSGSCRLRVIVDDGGPQTRGFGVFDFVVSQAGELAECYTVEEQQAPDRTVYEIVCALPLAEPQPVQVDLHSERGYGSALASAMTPAAGAEEPLASGIRLESCPDSACSCAPAPLPLGIRLPPRRRLHPGRTWRV